MGRVDGNILGKGWVRRVEESKAKILLQLKNYIQEMRNFKLSEGCEVANIDGGFFFQRSPIGPSGLFHNVDAFYTVGRVRIISKSRSPTSHYFACLASGHWFSRRVISAASIF